MIDKWMQSRLGDTTYAKNGQEVRVNCPFCFARIGREDSGRHMYVSLTKPVAHCFRCSWKGHHVSLVMSVDGCSYVEAIRHMEQPPTNIGLFDALYSARGLVQAPAMEMRRPRGFVPMYDTSQECSQYEYCAVYNYLLSRNVPDVLLHENFGYVPGTQRAWILVDAGWWQGRLIVHGEPKYLSPPWPRGASLWNAKALDTFDDIVICEGVFSALAVGDNAIALCGKTMSDAQAARLVNANVSSYTLLLDSGAEESAYTMAKILTYTGFAGELSIQYMLEGDPADGTLGDKRLWSWEEEMRISMQSA